MNDSKEQIIHEENDDEDLDQQRQPTPNQRVGDIQSTTSSNSTIIDFQQQSTSRPTSTLTTESDPQSPPNQTIGEVSTTLTNKDSFKSKSGTTGKSFKTIRTVATRIKVANQLSIAKRAGRDDVSISGGAMPEEPASAVFGSRPDFGSKPVLPTAKPLFAELFSSNAELQLSEKEGIISGGDLIFDNDFKSNAKSRPYIYVMPDVETKSIVKIMLSEWHLPVPRIAVFILSSVGELTSWHNSRQINAFKKGLMKAANTTSMWLVTNGLDAGIGKVIGDAIEKEQKEKQTFRYYENNNASNLNVIGIANEHNLTYTQQFFGKSINLGSVGSNAIENRYELNQNHSHFVLLNTASSSDSCQNAIIINLIDYLTKNALRSPEKLEEGPFFNGTKAASKFSPFQNLNDRLDISASTSAIPGPSAPVSIPPNGGLYKDMHLEHLAVDDTDYMNQDNLTTPETSGAPVPPETVSLSQISRQISNATLVPDTSSTQVTVVKKPSFVTENKPLEPPVIVEHYPIPGADNNVEHNLKSPNGHPTSDQLLSITNNAATRNASLLETSIIPVVCLVVQGGYECAKLVLSNLRRRNPVIVLRGSGGFADLLSYAYLEMEQRCRDMYQSWDAEFVEHTLKPLLTSKIVKRFPQFRNNALARNMFRDRIIECVRESGSPKGRIFLTILNMHNSSCDLENLSEYILLSLFKSQNRRDTLESNLIRKDLYLTIDWNCSHVALDEVLRRNPSYNLQSEKIIFEIALVRENREDFIDLFLSHGFQVHKYLTPFRFKRLLRNSLSESEFFRTVCMENILGIAVWSLNFEELMERLNSSEYSDADSFISNELNHLIYTCTNLQEFIQIDQLYVNILGMYRIDRESAERKSLAILAMWAVFNKKFKLAQICWKHSDQPIHLGLILSMMFDRMVWFVAEQNLKDELLEYAKNFAQAAVGVLDACYRQDEKRAFDLLSQENSDFCRKTAVDIAADGRNRTFIAHPCCQKWLTFKFNGPIRIREFSWGFINVSPVIKIVLSAFLIIPMYIWIRFVDDQLASEAKRKSIDDFHSSEGDGSDNEEDKFLSEHIKLMEMNSKESNTGEAAGPESAKRPMSNEQLQDTLKRIRNRSRKESRDTFRQRKLFIKKQPPIWTMIYLMWSSPITKFWTYQVFYILFLGLFSLAVIWPGCGNWYLDSTVCLWIFLSLLEHIRRSATLFHRYTSLPMVFKMVETIFLIILLIVYSLGRVFIYEGHSFANLFHPYTMKVLLSLGLLYHFYRLFAIHLPISPTLGPLLYRFKLMVTVDFIHFMRMALILLISGGIVIQAILYPNTELSIDTFHKAFHRAAISLFLTPVEELTVKCNRTVHNPWLPPNATASDRKFIFPIQPNQCIAHPIPMAESCPISGFWSYFFTFQFLISLKLILLTLLYALFASTASKLQSDTDNIWKFQRYTIVIDFANRPPLCAPLSIFSYLYDIFLLIFRYLKCCCIKCGQKCAKSDHVDSKGPDTLDHSEEEDHRLSQEDYNFWRHLAKAYYDDEKKKKNKACMMERQLETVQMICEEMEHNKHMLRSLKTKIIEMERLMFQTQIQLENIQHSTSTCPSGTDLYSAQPLSTSGGIHYLSRHSPYVSTQIYRFQIPDKFVSWDVIWINYDPVIYSRKREDFPPSLKSFVDEDILAIKESLNSVMSDSSVEQKHVHLPVFNWNAVSVNPAGLTYDRRSWLINAQDENNRIIYKLDDGIPLNPLGRTGLRGKGNLPRWGPNHYVMLILTRMNTSSNMLEFALEIKSNVLSLPMRFVGDDKPFTEIRSLLAKDDRDQLNEWTNEDDMKAYFKERMKRSAHGSVSVRFEPSTVNYMDSPDNTDNAWKEVKVYHVHFICSGTGTTLTDNLIRSSPPASSSGSPAKSHSTLIWSISTEDLLVRIPMEQVSFMNAVIRRLQPPNSK